PSREKSKGSSIWRTWRQFSSCSGASAASPPLVKTHSYRGYLPEYVDLVGIGIDFRAALRGGVRLKQNVVACNITPATGVSLTVFKEIDRPVEFVDPRAFRHFPPALVNHHQRARLQQRIHRPILGSDESV